MKWVVENHVFDEAIDHIVAEIKRQGMDVEEIRYEPFESGDYSRFGSGENCILFLGSLQLGRQLRREMKWIPGVWCNFSFFDCTHYYAYLGQFLLNQDYIMMPIAEFQRRKDEIYRHFSGEIKPNSTIFARPTSGFKGTFSGKLFEYQYFEKDWEWVEEDHQPDSMVVIASAAKIGEEWRFMVADGKVIAASQYKENGVYSPFPCHPYGLTNGAPHKVWTLAEEIAAFKAPGWEPEPMWVVDIGVSNGEAYLIEINSFSCSGWYEMDPESVIRAASKLAFREWKEIHA